MIIIVAIIVISFPLHTLYVRIPRSHGNLTSVESLAWFKSRDIYRKPEGKAMVSCKFSLHSRDRMDLRCVQENPQVKLDDFPPSSELERNDSNHPIISDCEASKRALDC